MGIYILFYRPTILTGVTPEMQLCQEEIFGPVVSILKFSEEKVSFFSACSNWLKHLAKDRPNNEKLQNLTQEAVDSLLSFPTNSMIKTSDPSVTDFHFNFQIQLRRRWTSLMTAGPAWPATSTAATWLSAGG